MNFSPLLLSSLIVDPLRYFFSQMPRAEEGLFWDPDEKITKIEIGTVNDFHLIPIQSKPRILINRGNYMVEGVGVSDNLAESNGIKMNYGKSERINSCRVNGAVQIIIETGQEGSCELITDMVSHFIAFTRGILTTSQGFLKFGLPMSVSACEPDKEDIEKFKVMLTVPYVYEDHWQVTFDAVKYKSMYLTIFNEYNPQQNTPILIEPKTLN